ncbi:MAG: hypothetical protein V4593_03925 [Pseudomonadota bacterium]
MTISIIGFTFVRNGVEFGFPFKALIGSLLPLVDEFVVAAAATRPQASAQFAGRACQRGNLSLRLDSPQRRHPTKARPSQQVLGDLRSLIRGRCKLSGEHPLVPQEMAENRS